MPIHQPRQRRSTRDSLPKIAISEYYRFRRTNSQPRLQSPGSAFQRPRLTAPYGERARSSQEEAKPTSPSVICQAPTQVPTISGRS